MCCLTRCFHGQRTRVNGWLRHVLAYTQFSWPKYACQRLAVTCLLRRNVNDQIILHCCFLRHRRSSSLLVRNFGFLSFPLFCMFNFHNSFLMFILLIIYLNLHSSTLFAILLHFFSVSFTFVLLAVLLSTCPPPIYLLFSITLLAFRSYLYFLL
jgi:hypothetical protein